MREKYMALIYCDLHNQQGVVHICPHIHDKFLLNENIDINMEYKVKRDELGITIYLCMICIEKYELSETLNFDELQKVGDALWSVCAQCMQIKIKG